MATETAQGTRRERKDAQQNLERVLQAAHELFTERGADVTMEDVARRAGVGVGTIYRRFPSKEHLLAAVSRVVCNDVQQQVHQAANGASDPLGKLQAVILVQYRRTAQECSFFELSPPLPGAEHACDDQTQLYTILHALLARTIADGQREGIIRDGDPDILAALCLELMSPRAFQHLSRIAGDDVDQIAEYAASFALAGLGIQR